jgi:hypothetical protein
MTANNDGDDVVWQIVRDYLNGYITWLCLRHYNCYSHGQEGAGLVSVQSVSILIFKNTCITV